MIINELNGLELSIHCRTLLNAFLNWMGNGGRQVGIRKSLHAMI